MIFETIISTVDTQGNAHVSPFGIQMQQGLVIISPYKPSITLDNILATQHAVVNLTDDVRVFAGALTGRSAWTVLEADKITGYRLADTLGHTSDPEGTTQTPATRSRFLEGVLDF